MTPMELLRFEDLCIPLGSRGRSLQTSGTLHDGKLLAVLGPSGAGKSTLLRILGRLEDRFEGRISWKGRSHDQVPATEWRRHIQYVHQNPVTFPGTVRENLLMPWQLSAFRDRPCPDEQSLIAEMEGMGLSEEFLEQDAQLLSGGERARLSLLRHIVSGPQVLLLDEPTASLDPASRGFVLQRLASWLKADGERGLCLVSHMDDHRAFPHDRIVEILLTPEEERQ